MNGVSVIIPTLNRGNFLNNTLECLKKQVFKGNWEIIIVDQSDKIDSNLSNISNAKLRYYNVHKKFRGLPEARNFGAQKASFDILLFIDDDVWFDQFFITNHYKNYTYSQIDAVAGGISEKGDKSSLQVGKYNKYSATPIAGFNSPCAQWVDHGKGCNYSIRTKIYLDILGTDENLNFGAALYEETEMFLRLKKANGKVWFNPEAHLDHLAAPAGGCRIKDIDRYISSLVHNRSIIIHRHLEWYHKPTAILMLLKLVCSYALTYRRGKLLSIFRKAYKDGKCKAKLKPKFTIFQ